MPKREDQTMRASAAAVLGLLLCQLPAAAGELEADDPCAWPCGREHTCGELNVSFTCDILSNDLDCDCTGCPSLPPPPSLPSPLLPPLAPGGLAASSTTELVAIVDELVRNTDPTSREEWSSEDELL